MEEPRCMMCQETYEGALTIGACFHGYRIHPEQEETLNDIPAESQGFVLELDKYLTSKGSKRTIKAAKSGFVTSYASPVTGKAFLN